MSEQTVSDAELHDAVPMAPVDAPDWLSPAVVRHALRQARKDKSATCTVLDGVLALLEGMVNAPLDEAQRRDLGAMLLETCGAPALFDDQSLQLWSSHPAAGALSAAGLLPLKDEDSEVLNVGAADPWDPEVGALAALLVGRAVTLVAMPSELLRAWLAVCEKQIPKLAANLAPELGNGEATASGVAVEPWATQGRGIRAAPGEEEMDRLEALEGYGFEQGIVVVDDDHQPAEVVSFVNQALHAAFLAGASDVHFEYSRAGLTVKLRQDGVMSYHSSIAGTHRAEEVISRIKVLAQLDITERRVPQDGRFRFRFAGGDLDLRVSIMPSVFGEDAVLRLLDKAQLRSAEAHVSLDLLGFDDQSVEAIRALSDLPHGMMLITGPTGSGKTTTVYGILSEVNTGDEKIITIEDPVEYELSGVLQIPVNEKKGLTFARGLRSILRHDPDRILVGEIRDAETAVIAVQSALTGHQVFTTVHANSVFDVTGRFKHFGLDMFGFMSALNGVIVQRLVRRLCPHCNSTRPPNSREAQWLEQMARPLDRVPLANGCPQCRETGYKGRFVIAEVHKVDDGLRDLVTLNAPVSQLREHIMKAGVLSLAEQGARMVADGKTTTEEIKRVVGWY